jgi:hypothetical protein
VRWLVPIKTYAASVSSRRLAETILASPEKDLPLYGYYYFRTGLPFYLGRPVGLVTGDASETTSNYIARNFAESRRLTARAGLSNGTDQMRLKNAGEVKPVLIDVRDLGALSGRTPILMLVRNIRVADLSVLFRNVEPLWAAGDYSVWKVSGARF